MAQSSIVTAASKARNETAQQRLILIPEVELPVEAE
jgi:hypothetical protein